MIETVNLRDSYKHYKQNTQSSTPADIKVYMHIVTGFMKFLMIKVLDGFQVQLGGGNSLGVLAVVGKKPKIKIDEAGKVKGLAPDWKETNKLWASNPEAKASKELIYHLNEHSNGIKYNLVWWKSGMKIGNKYLYSFTFCKPMKRRLSVLIREGKEYLVHN